MLENTLIRRNLSTAVKTLLLSVATTFLLSSQAYEIDPIATVYDSPASLMGISHISLSVKDLDATLEFYQSVSGFQLIRRETIQGDAVADKLYGIENVEYEVAVLEAPNMLFEFREFTHNQNQATSKTPVIGPGMTHTCFQTASDNSGYDRFKSIGAEILS